MGKSADFRRHVINKGAIGIVTANVTYEMGAAVWKAAAGQTLDGQAPYAWGGTRRRRSTSATSTP